MANEIVKATKVGEVGKIKGYEQYGVLRARHEFANETVVGPPEVLSAFSNAFIELPTKPEMMRIIAETDVEVVFRNQNEAPKGLATVQADIDELTGKGIDNVGIDSQIAVIKIPAGQEFNYRKRSEIYIAFKGTGIFEAW